MLAVFHQLANTIVQAAGSDAYHEVRELVVKYLSRFRSKEKLEQTLDATEQRVKANPKSSMFEAEFWEKELSEIASISAEANAAVRNLSQKLNNNVRSSVNTQTSGNHSPNQNVNITFNGSTDSGYTRQRSADQTDQANDPQAPEYSSTSLNLKTIGAILGIILVVVILVYSCSNGKR